MAPAGTEATTAATSRASGGGARCRGPQGAPWTTMSSRTAAPPHRPTPHRRVGAPTRAATREGTTGTTSDLLLNDRPGLVMLNSQRYNYRIYEPRYLCTPPVQWAQHSHESPRRRSFERRSTRLSAPGVHCAAYPGCGALPALYFTIGLFLFLLIRK